MNVERFNRRYGTFGTEGARRVQVDVVGAAVGVNGYTTIAQADRLAEVLALGPGRRLLDVGAGAGWPGLYLAEQTGCEVVLTDIPANAVRAAARRATEQKLADRCSFALASGVSLPFRLRSFDAVVHTDTL